MVVATDTSVLDYEPVSSLLVKTLIGAFTFLTALSIRDSVTQSIAVIAPNDTNKKLLFTFMVTLLFLFVTVLMAYLWQDKV
jgi:hypothetical protein